MSTIQLTYFEYKYLDCGIIEIEDEEDWKNFKEIMLKNNNTINKRIEMCGWLGQWFFLSLEMILMFLLLSFRRETWILAWTIKIN